MYNNPFLYQNAVRPSLFSRLLGRGVARGTFDWGNFLTNTQKSLGIINQAIPIVYQAKPILNNAKTMFRIAGAIKDDRPKNTISNVNNTKINNNNSPIFYI